MSSRLRRLLARPAPLLLVPLVLATAAYWRVLDGEFQFDDSHVVERNLAVKDLSAFVRDQLVAEYLHAGRPVTDLTFGMNYAVGRLVPWNYHLTNLAIHLAVVLLIWAFTREVLRLAGAARAGWVAVAVAGLFALHPVQSEAVSYVAQRSESLASALYLAALLLLLAAERRGPGWRAVPLWAAAFLAFAVGLGAKAIVVTLPAAWLLLAAAVPSPEARARLLSWPRRLVALIPFAAFDLLFAWRTMGGIAGSSDAGFHVPGLSPWSYLVTQLQVIPVYLRLLFWPAGQNVDWDFPAARSLADPSTLASGGLLLLLGVGAVALCVAARRRTGEGAAAARVAGFGVLWFFTILSVTSSVVPLADILVEHRLYLASWGIFVAAAAAVERLLARLGSGRVPALVAAAVVAVAWAAPAVALYRRNAAWETRRALWTDCVEKSPRKARAWLSLAYADLAENRLPQAEAANRIALSLAGADMGVRLQIYRNLGATLVLLGRVGEAEGVLREAVDSGYWDADVLNNLAVVLIEERKLADAEGFARRATTISPEKGEAWNTLGEIALRRGDAAGALRLFDHAVRLDPDVAVRQYNRGLALAVLGRVGEACDLWRSLRTAGDPGLAQNLARSWSERGCDQPR